MKKAIPFFLAALFLAGAVSFAPAGEKQAEPGSAPAALEPLQLPEPRQAGGRPLLEVLRDRQSGRDFRPDPLPPQVLSDLLWAAFGVNRPASGKRTAPTAMNWQEIDVYAVMKDGAYLYDASRNILQPVRAGDFRGDTGRIIQPFVKKAPLNLVYVADLTRVSALGKVFVSDEEKLVYSAAAAGFIGQNVYLFCASEGLSTVVRGMIDKKALAQVLNLGPRQKIILAQTVGYPKE